MQTTKADPPGGLLHRRVAGRELGVWLFVVGFPGVFVAAGVVLLAGFAFDVTEARRSRDWPAHPGQIERSDLTRSKSSTSHRIEYGYDVAGQRYRSARVVFGATSNGDSRGFVEQYRVGDTVEVHVDPADPGRAVLKPRMGSSWWVPPSFGLLFVAAGGVMAWWLEKGTRPRGRSSPWQSVPA